MRFSLVAVLAAFTVVSGRAPGLAFKTLNVTLENCSKEDLALPTLRYEARANGNRFRTYIDWTTNSVDQTSEAKPIRYLYTRYQPQALSRLGLGLKDTWSLGFDLHNGKSCFSTKDDGSVWKPHASGAKDVERMRIQFRGDTWDTLWFMIISAGHVSEGNISCTDP